MKNQKMMVLLAVALLSISFAFAWLDPPSADEKAYFKAALKNMSEKEFGGSGVTLGMSDMQTSIYVYKRQTLTTDGWKAAYKEAFSTNPATWYIVYDYILDIVKRSDLYETYGYLHVNNQTYWLENVSIENTSFTANFTAPNSTDVAGTVSLTPLFWSFWIGDTDIGNDSYKTVFLKSKG
jgi:hypothetical protein